MLFFQTTKSKKKSKKAQVNVGTKDDELDDVSSYDPLYDDFI